MTFELQTIPAPGLGSLGEHVELREVPYRTVRQAMSGDPNDAGDALLAACLHVDGVPIGREALDELPGRFTKAISRATADCLTLHGLRTGDADAPSDEDGADDDGAPASGEA